MEPPAIAAPQLVVRAQGKGRPSKSHSCDSDDIRGVSRVDEGSGGMIGSQKSSRVQKLEMEEGRDE